MFALYCCCCNFRHVLIPFFHFLISFLVSFFFLSFFLSVLQGVISYLFCLTLIYNRRSSANCIRPCKQYIFKVLSTLWILCSFNFILCDGQINDWEIFFIFFFFCFYFCKQCVVHLECFWIALRLFFVFGFYIRIWINFIRFSNDFHSCHLITWPKCYFRYRKYDNQSYIYISIDV